MRIAFRVDASNEIGIGHVMRCLTLADTLRERAADILFLCREHTGNLCTMIEQKGYHVNRLAAPALSMQGDMASKQNPTLHAAWLGADWQSDAQESFSVLKQVSNKLDWLIVDHYALDSRWESAMRSVSKRIMVIDDLADREHDCDLLLDQNLYDNLEQRYDGLLPSGCRQLLGPRYALLRPEFSAARSKLRERTGRIQRILVFFGGIDNTNQTAKSLEAIGSLKQAGITVDVAVGALNPHKDQISNQCSGMENVHFYCDASSISALMADADLSVGAGGTTTWERCALKLPAVAWPVAENQSEQLRVLAQIGAVYMPDPASIQEPRGLAAHIDALLNNTQLCRHISGMAGDVCDALGTSRIINHLVRRTLSVRRASVEDCKPVYEWRNHPITRRYSLNEDEIRWENHKQWFDKAINNQNIDFLIAEEGKVSVGVVRFDILELNVEVSIYLVPDKHAMGYGGAVLDACEAWLHDNRPQITSLSARILKSNSASVAIFERAGFERVYDVYKKRIS